MAYPYPELQHLMQFPFSAQDYEGWIDKHLYYMRPVPPALPTYIYARCPICGAIGQQQINVYSLHLKPLQFALQHGLILNPGASKRYGIPCTHYLGVHEFINLHDLTPHEVVDLYLASGEVPYVTPWFLPDDIDSFAVLHALPICQIVEQEFVPAYTHFMLTYFSADTDTIIKRCYDSQWKAIQNDDEYYPYTLAPAYRASRFTSYTTDIISELPQKLRLLYENYYGLSHWAANGKLGYLDFASPDLPLKIGKGLELPALYRNIPGRKYYFFWLKGKFRIF
ncbi:MAG: hypothetical protein K8L97_05600 [Anaerolineae bacterium]|nr:hypothetical protein [Anaerolineae bacterium]